MREKGDNLRLFQLKDSVSYNTNNTNNLIEIYDLVEERLGFIIYPHSYKDKTFDPRAKLTISVEWSKWIDRDAMNDLETEEQIIEEVLSTRKGMSVFKEETRKGFG